MNWITLSLRRRMSVLVTDLINIKNRIKTIEDKSELKEYAQIITNLLNDIHWLIDDAPFKPEVTDGEED